MLEKEFSKNSWHFEIVSFASPSTWGFDKKTEKSVTERDNICSYSRGFVLGLFMIAAIICAISIVSAVMLDPIITLVMTHFYGFQIGFFSPAFFAIGSIIWLFALSAMCTYYITEKIKNSEVGFHPVQSMKKYINENTTLKDSFIVLAYKSFKEKTCFKIKFNK